MAISQVTARTGGTIKPGPMVCAPPDRVTDDDALADFAPDSDLRGPFVADLLSAMVTHQRQGVALLRFCSTGSDTPGARSAFERASATLADGVTDFEDLIRRLDGSPAYISPAARMIEMTDQKLVEAFLGSGSADPLTLDVARADMVVMWASVAVANLDLLTAIAEAADEGASRDAMRATAARLREPIIELRDHATAAKQNVSLTRAKSKLAERAGILAERAVEKTRELFG